MRPINTIGADEKTKRLTELVGPAAMNNTVPIVGVRIEEPGNSSGSGLWNIDIIKNARATKPIRLRWVATHWRRCAWSRRARLRNFATLAQASNPPIDNSQTPRHGTIA